MLITTWLAAFTRNSANDRLNPVVPPRFRTGGRQNRERWPISSVFRSSLDTSRIRASASRLRQIAQPRQRRR